jgi:hypothetical protein
MRILAFMLIAAALAANAFAQTPERMEGAPLVAHFSAAGATMPPGWGPFIIAAGKRRTEYRLVEDQGQTVLNAKAEGAASALSYAVKFDVHAAPMLEWRWKVANLIEGADNSVSSKEDSPARVVLGFDGDRSKFTVLERASAAVSKSANGRDLPVSQLIYIWSNHAAVGTIIPNPRTKRVQMVVASSGPAGVGKWQTLSRNVLEDFRRAFGEEPGMLTDVGVLTDTDNTQGSTEAWYGDIRFQPAR